MQYSNSSLANATDNSLSMCTQEENDSVIKAVHKKIVGFQLVWKPFYIQIWMWMTEHRYSNISIWNSFDELKISMEVLHSTSWLSWAAMQELFSCAQLKWPNLKLARIREKSTQVRNYWLFTLTFPPTAAFPFCLKKKTRRESLRLWQF